MTVLTALEIASNHPNGDIEIVTVQHKKTEKWTSLLYMMRNSHVHKLMASFDIKEDFKGWDSEEEAKQKCKM